MSISRLRDAIRVGSPDPWADSVLGGGGKGAPAPPPPPDYAGAAVAQQKSQMSSQYTPYGNQVYSQDSSSPSGYKSTISLEPTQQETLDKLLANYNTLGSRAGEAINNFGSEPMDLQSVQDVSDRAYGQQTARLDPQWDARAESQEAALRNQGLVAGGEAYTNAMRDFNNARNDAYQQARVSSDATMPQTYQLANSIYTQPLNYYNALMTGAQVQNPQFSTTPGANYMGAAQSQSQYDQGLYNSQVGSQNSMMSGLMGMAGTLGSAFIKSDRRLKSNIKRIGTHRLGIGIYEYDIYGDHQVGLMADEVESVVPEAVRIGNDGFKEVNYAMVASRV